MHVIQKLNKVPSPDIHVLQSMLNMVFTLFFKIILSDSHVVLTHCDVLMLSIACVSTVPNSKGAEATVPQT